ncbi:hypothetical protein [Williamsia sp.]|uniref:hypothetical protein n=1 Tax=Williamsia sp. TaxID=1872085 RepID=UPI002F91CBF4
MLVRHRNPTFTGTVVLATIPFKFVSGIAEVSGLNASHLAAVAVKGWSVLDEPAPAEEETPKAKPKRQKEYEIGDDVDPEDMEIPEPEIG